VKIVLLERRTELSKKEVGDQAGVSLEVGAQMATAALGGRQVGCVWVLCWVWPRSSP